MVRFGIAWLLGHAGVFERWPGLQWRGRFRHPLTRWNRHVVVWINHSGGRITSTTEQVGRVSRNSRTGRTSVDLPGPLRWVSGRRR